MMIAIITLQGMSLGLNGHTCFFSFYKVVYSMHNVPSMRF